jgi:transposase
MRVEEEHRRGAPMVAPAVMASINAMLEQQIDRESKRVERAVERLFKDYPALRRQRELFISIRGIAETTAARILGEMPNITEFRDAKAVAAYAGLSPSPLPVRLD